MNNNNNNNNNNNDDDDDNFQPIKAKRINVFSIKHHEFIVDYEFVAYVF